MKKLWGWCKDNVLFLSALFLLAFIPLYPKLPLLDVKHVWVYVRVEDFLVLLALFVWIAEVVRRKLVLKTPLTIPILIYWIIGGIATIHGILLVFPGLANVFSNVALFSYVRRIEYMSLFFVAYTGFGERSKFKYVILTLVATVFLVSLYGIGQKYFSLPAYLTMNEEFAKGVPIQLSALSRVSSTFGGHYDLAAYLVLTIPIIVSLLFGYRSWLVRLILVGGAILSTFVLFMTVSRISFFALILSVGLVILMQKKKVFLFAIPIVVVAAILLLSFSSSLRDRFGNTVKEIDVLVEAKTGQPLGHVKIVPNTYFEHKLVTQSFFTSVSMVKTASPSVALIYPYTKLPASDVLLVEEAPTGENLPQGTGYINLSLAPVTQRITSFFYEPKPRGTKNLPDVAVINGDYLVKRASAYDLSFTTRFQGEWPNALAAFKRNVFFGSGYGSVSLAVDNSFLRMVAEIGAFGLAAFLSVFIAIAAYIWSLLPAIESKAIKSFVIGTMAGIAGLFVNGIFIDVFEASKVAFVLWLIVGATVAAAHTYQTTPFDVRKRLARIATSTGAIIAYLLIASILLYSPMLRNFFVGDDFTWFRWAAMDKSTFWQSIAGYFSHADGFFYRPGAKMYFLLMYSLFWLNQTIYHIVSLFVHFLVASCVLLLAKKVTKSSLLSATCAFLFLILSGASETIFWISATGLLFTAFFSLASVLSYATWQETKKPLAAVAAILFFAGSLLFHELGIVTPILYLAYAWVQTGTVNLKKIISSGTYRLFFLPIPVYLAVRFAAGSHWFNGDYSYNLLKLPVNAVGNLAGYIGLGIVGTASLAVYEMVRGALRSHVLIATGISAGFLILAWVLRRTIAKLARSPDARLAIFGLLFAAISLLPFLGLGNIAPRYGYLASVGIVFIIIWAGKIIHAFLLRSGKDIAHFGMILVILLFVLFHVVQLQQNTTDWFEAGETSQRFLIALQSTYDDLVATEAVQLHLVNVPIKRGEAWIYPVGITDALWLLFRNPKLQVYIWNTTEEARTLVPRQTLMKRIYVIDQSGEISSPKDPPATP